MILCLIALLGGVLLWLSQPPRHWPTLQLFALTALLLALGSHPLTWSESALIGFVFALGYLVPQLFELKLAPAITAILAVSQSFIWVLFALGCNVLVASTPIHFVLGIACLGTVLMWLEWSLLPLWGTAQNFARGWTSAPRLVQFVAFTGVAGLDWVLFFFAATLSLLILAPQQWQTLLSLSLPLALALALINFLGWNRLKQAPKLRVAAFGWAGSSVNATVTINSALVREAAEQGAQLLVTPEAAIQVENREAFRRTLQSFASQHRIALAIGYFDNKRNENCIDFVDARGEIIGRYVKTHLVPIFENYQKGQGKTAHLQVGGFHLGGLICQDDNFTDIAGKYGRAQTQLLVIPTHDWAQVKEFHYANSRWRALEFRLGIVRAASQGISAIVSSRGEILAYCDHFKAGPKLLVADLPIEPPQITFYARIRDWFPILSAVFLLWKLLIS